MPDKINIGDLVIAKLKQRRELVRAKLAQQYKGVRPLGLEKASSEEVMSVFNDLPLDKKMEILNKMGGKK